MRSKSMGGLDKKNSISIKDNESLPGLEPRRLK